MKPRRRLALGLAVLAAGVAAAARAEDLTQARLVETGAESAPAARFLAEEIAARMGGAWGASSKLNAPLVVVARPAAIEGLLPPALRAAWRARPAGSAARTPEGFSVRSLRAGSRRAVVVAAETPRGRLFGVGWLLRKLEMEPGRVAAPDALAIDTAPAQAVRGVQIGYRFKNNSYDAWTLAMFERRVRDIAIFGGNTIQVIAPVSDDAAASPLFPAPPLETIVGLSTLADRYGLDFALYYPELAKDYGDPTAVAAELKAFEALVRRLPKVDALYVPGGDPGHTPPDRLFPLVEQEARILARIHPGARVWLSAQGFDQTESQAFYAQLEREPDWLTGVFFGPQTRDPVAVQRRRIPARYPIQVYPDIGHTMHAQFPVPEWDPAFAITEGREPINPRPLGQATIFRHFAALNTGAVTYSEGVNDDVNMALWFQLGWSPQVAPREVLEDYARVFLGVRLGDQSSNRFADGVMALERNWSGKAADNAGIDATLALFDGLERSASPIQRANWRFESALYRAVYDAWVRARSRAEAARQAAAMTVLAQAPTIGADAAMAQAEHALAEPDTAEALALRGRLFDLAGRLYVHAGLQLSVQRYGASAIERGANLDRVDASLNDRVWLTRQFADIRALPDEAQRRARLAEIADAPMTRQGALYDDLGDPDREPHLVRGAGFGRDPQLLDSAIDGIADKIPDDGWRGAWTTYAETLYDRPITLVYRDLDPKRTWRLRATYAGEDYQLPMRLTANGVELHPPLSRATNPMTIELAIPPEATRSGALRLDWTRPPGVGGGGRGHQVAEVWLIPDPVSSSPSH
ncbi:hypothetical protein [Caulobacter sp. BK020]|uniref:hypothetical protein n=1 Tax=Caulobacter sp. BK020 TaxID=2512117 RepID=UPI0010D8EF2F|nr:hypothetical protein [Caulobacter sp. BK020]TCS17514.1 hypothetical protein EV278_102278 [Caulobacter sp. BK020]